MSTVKLCKAIATYACILILLASYSHSFEVNDLKNHMHTVIALLNSNTPLYCPIYSHGRYMYNNL